MRVSLLYLAFAFLISPAAGSSTWQLSTPSCTLVFEAGNIIGLENRLTGETLGSQLKGRIELAGIRLLKTSIQTDDMALSSLKTSETSVEARYQGQKATYTLAAQAHPNGDVILTQTGLSEVPGVAEIYWGISGVNASDTSLIVPGASGVEIDSSYKLDGYEFQWPMTWEAQMMIIKTPKGGFLIWSDDTDFRFKDFQYRRREGRWELRFGTQNVAPFDDLKEVSSVAWRITAFRGDWTVGAQIYKEWMGENLGLSPLLGEVSWAKDIRFVVIMNVEKNLLLPLSEQVNSSATLLYVPNWRFYEYDRNYPNYTASPQFPEFLSEAHRLGFRVMVHTNYFGVSPDHPLYSDMKKYQMRDPFSGNLLWWEWTRADPAIYIAYINPASAEWRSIFVQTLKEVKERYGVDAFHLDCSWAVWNDANGPIDGLTSTQGNLELHRQLHEAMPDVAFSGEGLNELTIRYERFAQRHVILGIDHVAQTWDSNLIDHLHPISAFLFCPYNIMYGYLGVCNPDSYPGLWHAWDTSYESLGVVPTLWLFRKDDLERPGPEMKGLLTKARYYTLARPTPVFPTPEPSLKFAFITVEGKTVCYRRKDYGVALEESGPDGGTTLITGRVERVNWAKTAGSIPGWLAYNASHILGLDPLRTYVLLGADRSQAVPHVSALPTNIMVARTTNSSSMFGVSLTGDERPIFDFVGGIASSSAEVVWENQSRSQICCGATWRAGVLSCGGQSKHAIYCTPPNNGLGATVGGYTLTIPETGARLRTFVGLTDLVRPGGSDGVVFRISVGDATVLELEYINRSWKEVDLDLSSYAGEMVVISFWVGPGPKDDARFDLAAWGEPQLLPYVPDPLAFDILCPVGSTGYVGEGVVSVADVPGFPEGARITGHVPLTYVILFRNATSVSPPFDLADAPFEVKVVRANVEEEPSGYASCQRTVVSCGGVSRKGLFEHTPPSGTTCASFLLDLPQGAVELQTGIGIADGSLSTGVLFIVRVNFGEVSRVEMLPSYWKEITVDLSQWAGEKVLLSLETDPDGVDYYDWAAWGEPRIVAISEIWFLSSVAIAALVLRFKAPRSWMMQCHRLNLSLGSWTCPDMGLGRRP